MIEQYSYTSKVEAIGSDGENKQNRIGRQAMANWTFTVTEIAFGQSADATNGLIHRIDMRGVEDNGTSRRLVVDFGDTLGIIIQNDNGTVRATFPTKDYLPTLESRSATPLIVRVETFPNDEVKFNINVDAT